MNEWIELIPKNLIEYKNIQHLPILYLVFDYSERKIVDIILIYKTIL